MPELLPPRRRWCLDFSVLCQVAVVRPACAAANYCECAEAAADEDSTGELLLGKLLLCSGLGCVSLFCRGLGVLVNVLSHVLFVVHVSRMPVYSLCQA